MDPRNVSIVLSPKILLLAVQEVPGSREVMTSPVLEKDKKILKAKERF